MKEIKLENIISDLEGLYEQTTQGEWCVKYCELYNLDCVYYRDWEIAERAYEDYMK